MNKQAFQRKYGPWAIVTGASAGIGAEFARQIAGKGLNVVLVARRAQKLEDLANKLQQKYGVETRVVALDLTTPDFLSTLREATADLEVGLLVNNAGAAELGGFLDNSIESELRILDLNVRAPMALSHAYGRDFSKKGRGGIVILSSMVGLVGVSGFTNYAATKAYDLILAEGLAKELGPQGVDVIGVAPGFTESEYMSGMDLSRLPVPLPLMKTSDLVNIGLNKLGTNTPFVVPGLMNHMMHWTFKVLGRKGSTAMMSWMIGRLGRVEEQAQPMGKGAAA